MVSAQKTIVLTLEILGNNVGEQDRAQEWSSSTVIVNLRASNEMIWVLNRVFSVLKSVWAENWTPHLPNFEFHKKSPEINVFTIDLDALKISARFIQYEKS